MEKKYRFDQFLTTGFYSGYWPWGPGTAGALMATLLWIGASCMLNYHELFGMTAFCVGLFTLVSIPSINRLERRWGEDPSRVVVDEMVGVWICLLAVPETPLFSTRYWAYVVAAFVLFRFFDILKPLGIRAMEKLPGGWGVLMDDILSGVYGALVMLIARWLGV